MAHNKWLMLLPAVAGTLRFAARPIARRYVLKQA
jgi:hypothetical protein